MKSFISLADNLMGARVSEERMVGDSCLKSLCAEHAFIESSHKSCPVAGRLPSIDEERGHIQWSPGLAVGIVVHATGRVEVKELVTHVHAPRCFALL